MTSAAYLVKPAKDGALISDVQEGGQWETGAGIVKCLQVKGFAAIPNFLAADVTQRATAEADDLTWTRPAALVQDGLLGSEGTSRLAKVPRQGAGDGLQTIDENMLDLVQVVSILAQDELDFQLPPEHLVGGFLHEVGNTESDDEDLTDAEANEWHGIFTCRKICILVCLGPDKALVEMRPFDEESNSTEIALTPGSLLVMRTDQLSCQVSMSGSTTKMLNYYMLQTEILRMHPSKIEEHLTPPAKELQEWVNNRLFEIKEEEPDQPDWEDDSVPRNFVAAANRTWFKRTLTTVSGISIRLPTTWETQIWYLSETRGVDYGQEVPFMRWDHSDIYDPHPEGWKDQWYPRTSCRHACFLDGAELFDNKLFGLSAAEVKGMDPSQRLCLEVTYDALHRSGKKKGQLVNSTCGMYVGISQSEWNFAERSADVGIFGATGGAPSICAGRLSFCLGCKGASIAIDTEAASGLSCAFWAAESVEKKGLGAIQDFACGIGLHLVIAKYWWPVMSAAGLLCPEGRAFSFDQSAEGYIRMEGIGCCSVRARKETTDDEPSPDDSLPRDGTIAGGANTNSGQCSSMTSPCGPSWQHCMAEACRKAAIQPADVEANECFGNGRQLFDAVEITSSIIAFRGGKHTGAPGTEEMLELGTSKSHGGNAIECSGLVGLAKMMHSIDWGMLPGGNHLRQLNPYVDDKDCAVNINEATMEFASGVVFAGISAFGLGGTNVHLTLYGSIDEEKRPAPEPTPEELRPSIAYWPAGGGDVESGARPRNAYYVIGTFNNWTADNPMTVEGNGIYSYVMPLGDNRWETFQIQLDNDSDKLLHPQYYRAVKGIKVAGPDEASICGDACWLIDGRGEMVAKSLLSEDGAIVSADDSLVEWGTEDQGECGDQYKITLHIAGKWRTVSWSKLSPEQVGTKKEPMKSKYFVVGAFAGWELLEMQEVGPGQFSLEVKLADAVNEFVILRNGDWHQTIFPASPAQHSASEVLGPEDRFDDLAWYINGIRGQKVTIELQRAGSAIKVSWR